MVSLLGSIPADCPDKVRIPTGRLCERYRSDSAVSMYHIMTENHRNSQPRLLHAPFLHHVPEVRVIREINHGPRLGRYSARHFTEIVLHCIAAQRILVKLHDLFFQSHTGKKIIDPFLDGSGRVLI